jgi:hypothetical protein
VVDGGLAGFVYRSGRGEFQEEPLERFVRWALEKPLVPAEVLPRYRRVYRVVDGKQRRFRRDQWWTSRKSIAAQGGHEVMRQRQEAARAERKARQKEQEEAAERRPEVEEQERARKAEEAERRRLEREEEARLRLEEARRRWVEEDARRERSGWNARRVWPASRPSGRSGSARTWRRRGRGGAVCRRSSGPGCSPPSPSTPGASRVFGGDPGDADDVAAVRLRRPPCGRQAADAVSGKWVKWVLELPVAVTWPLVERAATESTRRLGTGFRGIRAEGSRPLGDRFLEQPIRRSER